MNKHQTQYVNGKARTRHFGRYTRAADIPVKLRKEAVELMNIHHQYKKVMDIMNERHPGLNLKIGITNSMVKLERLAKAEEAAEKKQASGQDRQAEIQIDEPPVQTTPESPKMPSIEIKELALMLKDASDLRAMSAEFVEKYGVHHQDVLAMIGK